MVELAVVSGDAQTGSAGQRLSDPLIIRVSDADHSPLENMTVEFRITSGGGTLSVDSVRTDHLGQAQTYLTLGTAIGATTIEARALGLDIDIDPLTLTATTIAAAPAKLVKLTDDQTGTVGTPVAEPLSVRVEDAYQNPVIDTPVTFAVTLNNGTLSAATVSTDADGTASTQLTLGSAAGSNTVEAHAAALPAVVFTFQGYAGSAASLVASSGGGASGIAGSTLGTPFVVTALDSAGNPAPGTAITFAVTGGGGQLASAAKVAADANGRAQVTLTLGTSAGTNTVEARAGSLAAVQFVATGVAGPATRVISFSGALQSGIVAGSQAAPLIALVTDTNDNPVSGVTVSFTGGNLSPATANTGTNGRAQAMLTTATQAGANNIYAHVGSAMSLFSITTVAGPATHLANLGSSPSGSATVASSFSIIVQARDQYGNAVAGRSVAFSAGGGYSTSTSTGTAITDAQGRASTTWTLGTASNTSYSLTASSSGLPSLGFNVAGAPDAPASLATTGNGQVTICDGDPLSAPFTVTVLDRFGNRIPSTSVSFDTTDGCFSSVAGCPKQVTLPVDGAGTASVIYRTGTHGNGSSTTEQANARVGGLVHVFSATVNGC